MVPFSGLYYGVVILGQVTNLFQGLSMSLGFLRL